MAVIQLFCAFSSQVRVLPDVCEKQIGLARESQAYRYVACLAVTRTESSRIVRGFPVRGELERCVTFQKGGVNMVFECLQSLYSRCYDES